MCVLVVRVDFIVLRDEGVLVVDLRLEVLALDLLSDLCFCEVFIEVLHEIREVNFLLLLNLQHDKCVHAVLHVRGDVA